MDEIYKIIGQNLFTFLLAIIPAILGVGIYINKVNNLQKELDRIRKILDDNSPFGGIVKKRSPLSLTKKGEKILKESGAQFYIDNNKVFLISEIKKQNPKSSYDVQELSQQIIESHKNDDNFIPIKEYVYKEGLELEHVIMGMTVYLRDFTLTQLGFNKNPD